MRFHDNIKPIEGPHCICLSTILIGSAFRIGKNYYPKLWMIEIDWNSNVVNGGHILYNAVKKE